MSNKRKQEIQLTKDDVERGLDIDQEIQKEQEQLYSEAQALTADEETLKQRKKFKIRRQLQQEQQPESDQPRKNPFASINLMQVNQQVQPAIETDIQEQQPEQEKKYDDQQQQENSQQAQAPKQIPSTETIIQTNINEVEQRDKRKLEEDTANTKQESNKRIHQGEDNVQNENIQAQLTQAVQEQQQIPENIAQDTLYMEKQGQSIPNSEGQQQEATQEAPKTETSQQETEVPVQSSTNYKNPGFSTISTFGQNRESFGQGYLGNTSKSLFSTNYNTPSKDAEDSKQNQTQNGFKLDFAASNSIFNLNQNRESTGNENGNTNNTNNNNNNTPGAFSLFSNIKTPNSTLTETKPQQLKVEFDKNFKQITGEEDEEIIFKGDGTLYVYVDAEQQWRTKGTGDVRIVKDKNGKCRIIIRQKGVYRVLLNAKLWPDMKVQQQQNRTSVTFSCINFANQQQQQNKDKEQKEEIQGQSKINEDKQRLETYALRIKNHEDIEYFIHCIDTNKKA